MFYKEFSFILDTFVAFLKINNIECPVAIKQFNSSLKNSIRSGVSIPKQEMGLIERYLFPDAGMGWLNDLQYNLSTEANKELEQIIKKLHVAWEK